MSGAFKFKDSSGNLVSYISGSDAGTIIMSASALDLSNIGALNLGSLVISGSTQNASTASYAPSYVLTSSFNTATGSFAITGSNTFKGAQTFSGSLIPAVNSTYDLGDATHQFRHLYLSSASLYIDGTKVLGSTSQELQITTDVGQSFKILESGADTITLQSADGNITVTTSGGGDVILDPNTGVIALKGTTTVYSGYKIVSSDGNNIQLGNGLSITGSIVATGTALVSGSSQIVYSGLTGIPSGIISGSSQLPSGLVSGSSQVLSGSTVWSSSAQLPSGVVSGSSQIASQGYATTGSNVYQGNQTITGSLYISSNLVVQGSSSLQDITGSNVYIGTNKINLNTNTPAIRFGGISVFDSGSNFGESGSLLWDSQNNRWLYQHPTSSGAPYKSAILISGPMNSGSLGSEDTLTAGKIMKSLADDHIGDSIMTETNGGIGINGPLSVTGAFNGTNIVLTNGANVGSLLVNDPGGSAFPGFTNRIGGNTAIVGTTVISGSLNITGSLIASGSNLISSSTQVIYSGLTGIPSGVVSGSSQILNGTTIHSGSFFNGISVVSGSSQISLASTNDFSTYLDQAVKSGSTVTFAGVTTAGAKYFGGGGMYVSTDTSYDTTRSYTFRDAMGISNPNGTSAATGTTVVSIGGMSNGVSLITTGYIGVKKNSANAELDVNGNAIVSGSITSTSTITSKVNGSTFGTSAATGRAVIIQGGSANQVIQFKNALGGDATLYVEGTSSAAHYRFDTYSTSNAFFIANGGNIGVNTNNPGAKIDVADGGIRLTETGVSSFTTTYSTGRVQFGMDSGGSDGFYFRTYNSGYADRFSIRANGRVMVGTGTPNGILHVGGSHVGGYGIVNIVSTDNALIALESTSVQDVRIRYKYGGDKWLVGLYNSDNYSIRNGNNSSAIDISTGLDVTMGAGLSVTNNISARNFNMYVRSWSTNGAYLWYEQLDAISSYFDSAGWYKGFIRESNSAHYHGYYFDILVAYKGYGGLSSQYRVFNIVQADSPYVGGCSTTSFAAIDNSGFTKQSSACYDTLQLYITKLSG